MRFLGFRLCSELGRDAFGRVFLAQQGDLADRPVALKVSADVAGESHVLARLQHTNVVPIFSVHRRGPLQAVCMPFSARPRWPIRWPAAASAGGRRSRARPCSVRSAPRGPVSLGAALGGGPDRGSTGDRASARSPSDPAPDRPPAASADRLRALGYVPAVLWVMARVADGLAHAHERGILAPRPEAGQHPFADDGEPILLDFNLAADRPAARRRRRAGRRHAAVHGPGTSRAFRNGEPAIDARSDVYLRGVILHEAPQRPRTRSRSVPGRSTRSSADDRRPASGPARHPAGEPGRLAGRASIVRHCLDPDP